MKRAGSSGVAIQIPPIAQPDGVLANAVHESDALLRFLFHPGMVR
jgi:hypothetical protein